MSEIYIMDGHGRVNRRRCVRKLENGWETLIAGEVSYGGVLALIVL